MRDKDLVVLTPEHVQIRLKPAGLAVRFAAWSVDMALIMGMVLFSYKFVTLILPAAVATAVFLTLMFVGMWAYHMFFELKWEGRSPGKRAMGIRVVDQRGLPISLPQSFIRNVVRAFDSLPLFYGVGGLIALLDPHGRRLGDIAAGTLVITDVTPMEYKGQLAQTRKFNTLRDPRVLRMIHHRIGLEEREFLLTLCLRAETLDSKTKFDLMETVGNHYREVLGIEDAHLSSENLVLDLTAILYEKYVVESNAKRNVELEKKL